MAARAISDATTNTLVAAYMAWGDLTLRAPLLRCARHPAKAQRRTLLEIVRANADTEFGRDHGFAAIDDLDSYRARLPVRNYDELAPYIQRQARHGVAALTADPPVYYARTSGTTGPFKDIPLTETGVAHIKRAQRLLGVSLHAATGFFRGRVVGLASPAVEGSTSTGAPYGSASGGVHRSISPLVARKFAVPPEVYAVSDYEAKYRLYAFAALAAPELTGVVTANPSSILKVLDVLESQGGSLLDELERAVRNGSDGGSDPILGMILARSGCDPRRLRLLREILAVDGRLTADAIWPRLAAVATWTGGSCGVALERLAPRLPPTTRIVEIGYSASELMGTVNVDARRDVCLPLLNEHVYEFVPRAAREAGRDVFLGVEELEVGEEYYVVVTTRSGLYRYDINDIVRATAGIAGCVGLVFVQKGRGVTSITGEKLTEHQVIAAVRETFRAHGIAPANYMLLADEQSPHYDLLIEFGREGEAVRETFAADLDARLRAGNEEYAQKRASGRLEAIRTRRLRVGAGEAVKRAALAAGVREAQYKPVMLDYWCNWSDRLGPLWPEDAQP